MGIFTSIINTVASNRRTRKTVRNIDRANEIRRGVVRYEPSDIEAFIERDNEVGSYLVSGGISYNRTRTAASVAVCGIAQGLPVVVLHEGNRELETWIKQTSAGFQKGCYVSSTNPLYDPFFNRTNTEICSLILNSVGTGQVIEPIGQQYIEGITRFIKSKNIPPHCDMFVRTPFDELYDKIDEAVNLAHISSAEATQIRNYLMQGQSEKSSIQAFFSQLSREGAGVLANKSARNNVVNIREAVNNAGLLMIDIGSSSKEVLLNIIVNEINDVLAKGSKVVIVIDGISVNANKELANLIRVKPAKCLLTLVSEDIYSMLGADEGLFQTTVGRANKCVVFSHFDGISCNKWSDVFGQYEADKVSHNFGTHQNFQWGYGSGNQNAINIAKSRENRIKPEEIASMTPREVFVLDQVAHELAYTTIR